MDGAKRLGVRAACRRFPHPRPFHPELYPHLAPVQSGSFAPLRRRTPRRWRVHRSTGCSEIVGKTRDRHESGCPWRLLPKRWLGERTFGWLRRHRRLARDYERTEASAAGWIHVAMIRLRLRRTTCSPSSHHFSDTF